MSKHPSINEEKNHANSSAVFGATCQRKESGILQAHNEPFVGMHFICRLWFFIFLARVKDCSQPRVSCSAPQSPGYFPNAACVLNTPSYTFNHYIFEDSSQRMLITHRAAMTYRTWYRREWDRQNIGQTEHRTDRTSDRQDIRQTGHQTNSKRISSREHNGENIGQTGHQTDRTSDRQDIWQTGHRTDRTSDRQDIRQTRNASAAENTTGRTLLQRQKRPSRVYLHIYIM